MIKKSFWQSKIIIAGFIQFIAGAIQATTGWYVAHEVLEAGSHTIFDAVNAPTIFGAINLLSGLYLIVSRSLLKTDQIEKVWYKSGIFLTGLFTFLSQIAYYQTGIDLPVGLTESLVDQLIVLFNGGEIIPFFVQVLPLLVSIWRNYATTAEVGLIVPLKPVLKTSSLKKAA